MRCNKCKKGKMSVHKIKSIFNEKVIEVITHCLRCGYTKKYDTTRKS